MADIKLYIDNILNAVYGEEVRSSIVNAINKINTDNESYIAMKEEVLNNKDIVQNFMAIFDSKVDGATVLKDALEGAINAGNTAKTNLDDTITVANNTKMNVEESTEKANNAKVNLDSSVKGANGLIDDINRMKTEADLAKGKLDESLKGAGTMKTNLDASVATANTAKTNIEKSTSTANGVNDFLVKSTATANGAKTALETATSNAVTKKGEVEKAIADANMAIKNAGTAKTNLESVVKTSETMKSDLTLLIQTGKDIATKIETANGTASGLVTSLNNLIQTATATKDSLQSATSNAEGKIKELNDTILLAKTTKSDLDSTNLTAEKNLKSLQSENISSDLMLKELRSENFNSQEILTGVTDIRAYLGMIDDIDVVGLSVDYQNKTFERLASAKGLNKGVDFDKFPMFGGRRRCNVLDDGTITAYHGDPNYTEDGSNGQVMVYQPAFYYMVCPINFEPITSTGIGYHLRKANYYVSENPHNGFRLHPAFYDANGNAVDYVLMSAYEGSIFDTSANAYLAEDEQVGDFTAVSGDKLCSISGVKPASGLSQQFTRPNVEQIAQNRGQGWHSDNIKITSMNQLLMIIEAGTMNTQTAYGQGVTQLSDVSGQNCSIPTGATSSLGNASGMPEGKNGHVSITYRGVENPYGNIWKFVYGVNIFGDGKMDGGQPYICTDFNYAEGKNSGNYESAGFTLTNKNGYISAMGYSQKYDWLFMASETDGNSSVPVGDYHYVTIDLNSYRIACIGGSWPYWSSAGGFYWRLTGGIGYRIRSVGGRLVYVPTAVIKTV